MTDTPPTPSAPVRHANGRFGPGNPGRRAGSRNRASHKALMSILDDFEKHKEELLKRLRNYHSPNYFNTLARLAPQMLDDEAPQFESYSEAEAARVLARARQVLASTPDPLRALTELDAVLATDPAGHR